MTYYSLKRRAGRDNMGGMATRFLFTQLDELSTIKPPKTTTNPGDSITIDGSHVWASGKGAHDIFFTPESVTLKSEPQGEMGGISKKITVSGFYPGTSKAAAELDRKSGNDEFIGWVKDPNTGNYIQIGSEDFPATIKCTYDSGQSGSGRKGYTIEISASMHGLTFYEGAFTMATEATNSGSGTEDDETYVE